MSAAYARRQSAFDSAKLPAGHLSAIDGCFVNTHSGCQPQWTCLHAPTATAVSPSPLCIAHSHQYLNLPLFWSLFNALRADVGRLDTRVGDLEHHVSDLEDRIDHYLGPSTPAESLANISDDSCSPTQAELKRPDQRARLESVEPSSTPIAPQMAHIPHRTYFSREDVPMHNMNHNTGATPGAALLTMAPQMGKPASSGVAFRDKEINDLEELVRSSQDSLKRSEETSRRNAIQVSDLLIENASLQRQLSHREAALATCSDRLSATEVQLEDSRTHCHVKDEKLLAWTSKHESLHQTYLQQQDELAALKRRLQQVYSLQASRQQEIDELVGLKDDDLGRLRALCESKHEVLVKQEEVIARGITLMRDKDGEMEQLRLELRALKDDFDSAAREKERYARLFQESGEVIAELRASPSQAPTPAVPKHSADDTPETNGTSMAPCSPFANSTRAVSWTPKPFKFSALPSERKRAEIWQSGSISTACAFGETGWQNGFRGTIRSNGSRYDKKLPLEQTRKAGKRPEVQAQPRQHNGLTAHAAGSTDESLPPWPPRRCELSSDQCSSAAGEMGPRLTAQHVPVREPCKRGLQPYVEAGEE
ncbi:hypothetical protein CERZMDRAFT_101043 [Cercospora zeae-maydis SCOH1-5]|uniref:Uncharacterized protein n=1 Tax=Cercospora zeae-maydis SCOH1-5 TaxID=717836 RepID=A0A6A6F5Y3_9PEZI|nr:hypothetical protein CERZMDRAFT_101043 [Cercospora zeae-maydis SCOH1-5]